LIPPQEWLAAFHFRWTASLSPTLRMAAGRPAAHESTAGKPFVSIWFGLWRGYHRASKI